MHLGHPAHVHFFKNIINGLNARGHEVRIIARKKDVNLELLDIYKLKYEAIQYFSTSITGKMLDLLRSDLYLYQFAKKYKPDIMVAIGLPGITHIGKILEIPSIYFTDTEEANFANMIASPFADVVCTPKCFLKNFGKNHVKINGYKELAYLHPNYFRPDPEVLDQFNLNDGPYIITRLISWGAHHDIGLQGIQRREIFFKKLENFGRLIISSEGGFGDTYSRDLQKIPPEKLHSLLAFASMYIGEGGTMAAESAILGTPAIHIEKDKSGKPTGETSGNFLELRDKYDLLYFYPDQEQALEKALTILKNKNAKHEWKQKRDTLLKEKVDVTRWMIDFIEGYPESYRDYLNIKRTLA